MHLAHDWVIVKCDPGALEIVTSTSAAYRVGPGQSRMMSFCRTMAVSFTSAKAVRSSRAVVTGVAPALTLETASTRGTANARVATRAVKRRWRSEVKIIDLSVIRGERAVAPKEWQNVIAPEAVTLEYLLRRGAGPMSHQVGRGTDR